MPQSAPNRVRLIDSQKKLKQQPLKKDAAGGKDVSSKKSAAKLAKPKK